MSRAASILLATVSPSGVAAERALPEEVPVALVYNGSTYAVMMATPADLEDFAIGFALTEGIASPDEAGEVEIVSHEGGIEARLWLPELRAEALAKRRRTMAGPVGCGLCGIDSLAEVIRVLPPLPDNDARFSADQLLGGLDALRNSQPLHDETRAVHAAGLLNAQAQITAVREDVGRHNALDKLAGALARTGPQTGSCSSIAAAKGAVLLTSRISVEMVQKTHAIGARIIVSVSAPTALAVRNAQAAGITIASREAGAIRLYSHPHRVFGGPHVQ
ncbi:MAG: formate dehydrogenase accessory sulfurtransferase FdhD [Rhodobacteraceae bacterium]|nr:formate dehydrogenase accessory sulfurtransferase FdhD [Paracoccaceae bacterium]